MQEVICPGVPANWINSWLAAVGATVLDARIRIHWTAGTNIAVFSAVDCDPVDVLANSWPREKVLSELPISSRWKDAGVMERRIAVENFQRRARAARGHPQSWTLSSTVTDLNVNRSGEVAHAPFDPPGPGSVKWLHYRLRKIHAHVPDPEPERIRASLTGEAPRVQDNGLGFDLTRIGSGADQADCWTDPILEVMAFFGLALFPMRGAGVDLRLPGAGFDRGRQRGWRRTQGSGNISHFHWPSWSQPLNTDGIDALLDIWNPVKKGKWSLLGVQAGWRSAAYKTSSANDPTRAYGADRI